MQAADAATKPFLTQRKAAPRLGIHPDTVSEGIKHGRILVVATGRNWSW